MKDRILSTQQQVEDTDETQLEGSAQIRLDTWSVLLKVVSEHPFDGVGFLGLPYVLPETGGAMGLNVKDTSHNTFLRMLAELGVFGLLLFCFILWKCWWLGERGVKAAQNRFDRQLALGLVGATLALALSCWFGDRFFSILITGNFWMLCALVDASRSSARTRRRSSAKAAPLAQTGGAGRAPRSEAASGRAGGSSPRIGTANLGPGAAAHDHPASSRVSRRRTPTLPARAPARVPRAVELLEGSVSRRSRSRTVSCGSPKDGPALGRDDVRRRLRGQRRSRCCCGRTAPVRRSYLTAGSWRCAERRGGTSRTYWNGPRFRDLTATDDRSFDLLLPAPRRARDVGARRDVSRAADRAAAARHAREDVEGLRRRTVPSRDLEEALALVR